MNLPCLGIDIAKLKFNVCLLQFNGKLKHKVFPNTAAGFAQLQEWLQQQSESSRCMPAWKLPALTVKLSRITCTTAGHTVSVMNPAAIKAFAASRLSRTKTDRVDAELIARFCLAHQPPPWTPPAPEVRELQALVRRLESLIEMRVAEENRLSAGLTVAAVRSSVEEMIAHLKDQITRTEKLIRKHIDKHPGLKQQSELLNSIPGIADTTAAVLLAEVPDIKLYPQRAPGGRLRWSGAARASVGQLGEGTSAALKDRQRAFAQGALLPGHHRTALQSLLSTVGRRVETTRQV